MAQISNDGGAIWVDIRETTFATVGVDAAGQAVASGMYLASLEDASGRRVRKLVLAR